MSSLVMAAAWSKPGAHSVHAARVFDELWSSNSPTAASLHTNRLASMAPVQKQNYLCLVRDLKELVVCEESRYTTIFPSVFSMSLAMFCGAISALDAQKVLVEMAHSNPLVIELLSSVDKPPEPRKDCSLLVDYVQLCLASWSMFCFVWVVVQYRSPPHQLETLSACVQLRPESWLSCSCLTTRHTTSLVHKCLIPLLNSAITLGCWKHRDDVVCISLTWGWHHGFNLPTVATWETKAEMIGVQTTRIRCSLLARFLRKSSLMQLKCGGLAQFGYISLWSPIVAKRSVSIVLILSIFQDLKTMLLLGGLVVLVCISDLCMYTRGHQLLSTHAPINIQQLGVSMVSDYPSAASALPHSNPELFLCSFQEFTFSIEKGMLYQDTLAAVNDFSSRCLFFVLIINSLGCYWLSLYHERLKTWDPGGCELVQESISEGCNQELCQVFQLVRAMHIGFSGRLMEIMCEGAVLLSLWPFFNVVLRPGFAWYLVDHSFLHRYLGHHHFKLCWCASIISSSNKFMLALFGVACGPQNIAPATGVAIAMSSSDQPGAFQIWVYPHTNQCYVAIFMISQLDDGIHIRQLKWCFAGSHVLLHAATIRLMLRAGKGEQRVCKIFDAPHFHEGKTAFPTVFSRIQAHCKQVHSEAYALPALCQKTIGMQSIVDGNILEANATSASRSSVHAKYESIDLDLQVPWDPGALFHHLQARVHWLEGKPILKKGGMSVHCQVGPIHCRVGPECQDSYGNSTKGIGQPWEEERRIVQNSISF